VTFEEILPEFYQENQKLCKTMQIPRNSGRRSANEREKRREEVFRLHFELGYPATKIAEVMNVNRNTINNDINYWYSRLSKTGSNIDLVGWCQRQLHRLETQRRRLLEYLEKDNSLQARIGYEKMIFEIDSKISHIVIKMSNTNESMLNTCVSVINRWAEKQKLDVRYISKREITKVSSQTLPKIKNILKNDEYAKDRFIH